MLKVKIDVEVSVAFVRVCSVINDREVHAESVCSVSWEISLRKASVGPESTLPGKKGSFAQLYVLARISAHPSLFSLLIVRFLTV